MPLSEKARIEVYLPDLPRAADQDLLAAFEQEFSYTFGGCSTIRAKLQRRRSTKKPYSSSCWASITPSELLFLAPWPIQQILLPVRI